MSIDQKDARRVGKIALPFTLMLFIALLLEEYWSSWDLNTKLLVIGLLVVVTLFVYKRQVKEILKE
jgi:hypothetical protein